MANLPAPRTQNPFDDDYLWYLVVKDKRDSKSHTLLTPKQKKELRNKAIVFLSQHGVSRMECCKLFDIGPTMVSTIVSKSPEGTGFAHKYYKMTQELADEIREKSTSHSGTELAQMYGVSNATISLIINNKRWVKKV